MRSLIIILTIFLISGIWSCQSSRHTTAQTRDLSTVKIAKVKASMTAEDVLTWLTTSTDIDLSGITVEFYAPDTANPGARASPKSLTIAEAKARRDTQAATYEHRTEACKDTVNVEARATHDAATDTVVDKTAFTMPRWISWLAITAVAVIAILSLLKIFRSKKS